MLYTQTLERNTFELLKELMKDPCLSGFNLVGGTALALYLGHRTSIDLDLFSLCDFNADNIESHLYTKYGFETDFKKGIDLKGFIGNVRVDCIAYRYPTIKAVGTFNQGLRLLSMNDIAAMKLSAIADNGSRLKDFFDIACLSTKLSLSDMLEAYRQKFPNTHSNRALRGLTYYYDIDFEGEPILTTNGTFSWEKTQKRIKQMIARPLATFPCFPHLETARPRHKLR